MLQRPALDALTEMLLNTARNGQEIMSPMQTDMWGPFLAVFFTDAALREPAATKDERRAMEGGPREAMEQTRKRDNAGPCAGRTDMAPCAGGRCNSEAEFFPLWFWFLFFRFIPTHTTHEKKIAKKDQLWYSVYCRDKHTYNTTGGLFMKTKDDYNTSGRRVQEVPIIKIPPHHVVYASRQGKYMEVAHMAVPPKATIRKLDKDRYEVISTGEIGYFEHNRTGEKQIAHMRKSMKRLKGIIRANFGQNVDCERHITFTYKSNMQDPEKLMRDFQKWQQRMQYAHDTTKFDYIAIAEPQERGAWHIHLLIKADKPIYWDYNKIGKMWKGVIKEDVGNPQVEEITADDVGSYFAAYFSTVIDEEADASGDPEKRKEASKAAKKGSRLHLYPPYFKFYRCSRGIIRPKPTPIAQHEISSEFGEPVSEKRFTVLDDHAIMDVTC